MPSGCVEEKIILAFVKIVRKTIVIGVKALRKGNQAQFQIQAQVEQVRGSVGRHLSREDVKGSSSSC